MSKIPSITVQRDKQLVRILILASIAIMIFSGWLWWQRIYLSPKRVFWGMLNNSLSVGGVTRHISQSDSTAKITQTTQIVFGAQNVSHTLATLTQKNPQGGDSVVNTENLGTPSNDYSRYIHIQSLRRNSTGKAPDFSKIEGVWGKSEDNTGAQYLSQASLGVIPFANLNSLNRRAIINLMETSVAYKPDLATVKREGANYTYTVSINPGSYINVLKELSKLTGISQLAGLNASDYQNSPPLQAAVTVNKISRQLLKITYAATNQEETYDAYGLKTVVSLPSKTITLSELQTRLFSLQ